MDNILRAHSRSADAHAAVEELKNQFSSQPAAQGIILFFCSALYDLTTIAASFNTLFPDAEIVGCTSAGEIGPEGYVEQSISAVFFPRDDFSVNIACLRDLNERTETDCQQFVQELLVRQNQSLKQNNFHHSFAMQLIDGVSKKEETISYNLQKRLGSIPLFGGSAANYLNSEHTYVFYRGEFLANSSLLLLFSTNRLFRLFKTQHFSGSGEPLVVTAADINNRTIIELNGLPATDVYAHQIGCRTDQLNASLFAASPIVIKLNGNEYIRSIQYANDDGSLRLYCAIDEGVILRVAHGTDLITDLQRQFNKLQDALGSIALTIICDCILRHKDIENKQQLPAVSDILMHNHAIGFSSFGEQFGGLHLNQTCTGIAFGCRESKL
jgi:hypothetical protein